MCYFFSPQGQESSGQTASEDNKHSGDGPSLWEEQPPNPPE